MVLTQPDRLEVSCALASSLAEVVTVSVARSFCVARLSALHGIHASAQTGGTESNRSGQRGTVSGLALRPFELQLPINLDL